MTMPDEDTASRIDHLQCYFDGELSADDRSRIEQMLAEDAAAQQNLRRLTSLRQLETRHTRAVESAVAGQLTPLTVSELEKKSLVPALSPPVCVAKGGPGEKTGKKSTRRTLAALTVACVAMLLLTVGWRNWPKHADAPRNVPSALANRVEKGEPSNTTSTVAHNAAPSKPVQKVTSPRDTVPATPRSAAHTNDLATTTPSTHKAAASGTRFSPADELDALVHRWSNGQSSDGSIAARVVLDQARQQHPRRLPASAEILTIRLANSSSKSPRAASELIQEHRNSIPRRTPTRPTARGDDARPVRAGEAVTPQTRVFTGDVERVS